MKTTFKRIIFSSQSNKKKVANLQNYLQKRTGVECPVIRNKDEASNYRFCIRKLKLGRPTIEGSDVIEKFHQDVSKKKILTIMAVYNEDDIVSQTIEHYINQGTDVYVIDNNSNDETPKIIEALKEKYPGQVMSENFPKQAVKAHVYDAKKLKQRIDQVAAESNYEWILFSDADEMRTSPSLELTLVEYISMVDNLKYNAIDFTVIDFWPTKDGYDGSQNPKTFFKYFEFGRRPGHFQQVKGWKNQHKLVGLEIGGGHGLNFEGMKVYPLKFLLKHYPIRSNEQAYRKLYQDRIPIKSALKKGWHSHYARLRDRSKYIRKPRELTKFTQSFYDKFYVERLTGVGLRDEN